MPLLHAKPNMAVLPGGWEPEFTPKLSGGISPLKNCIEDERILFVDGLLDSSDCEALIKFMDSAPTIASVSVHGRNDIPNEGIGSQRTTVWSEALAKELGALLLPHLSLRSMCDTSATDWWQGGKHKQWRPIGLSPLLRFMRYEKGGQHYAHYDAGYIYSDPTYRTLMSLVIYLTTNQSGGATRFIRDGQDHLPIWERDHNDWDRPVREDEVVYAVQPKQGAVLIFDHRKCHDVELYSGGNPRIIIRGDVLFELDL